MTENELNTIWEYYLIIEEDLANTARFVEPAEQENVYSFEFQKIIILACTEFEKVIKKLAKETCNTTPGNMCEYKDFFMSNYPKIVDAVVRVSRLGREIKPFENWNNHKLSWWDAYTQLKHGSDNGIKNATCINAIYAMAALYILIFYLSKITKIKFSSGNSKFIHSDYGTVLLALNSGGKLPDFNDNNSQRKTVSR